MPATRCFCIRAGVRRVLADPDCPAVTHRWDETRERSPRMFTKEFALATLERALKTFAQTLVSLWVIGSNIVDIEWDQMAGVAAGAAVLSILTSIVSGPVGGAGPSLGAEVVAPPAP